LLLGRALQQHYGLPPDANLLELGRLAELDPRVPDVLVTHDDQAQWKTPAEVERDKGAYARRRVVLLVRDPRDVIVSLYYQKRFRRDAYAGSLADYLDGPDFEALLAFCDAWAAQLDVPAAVLVVRYEDLHADPPAQLRRVLDFLGVRDVRDAVVEDAVEYASFDNMRRLEETDAFGSDKLRPAHAGRPESYKTRRGRVGGFRDELTADQVARLDERMAASGVGIFGYGSSSS
jgi:hypothetical protein